MIRAGSGGSSGQDVPGARSAAVDGVVVERDNGYADWGEARPEVSSRGGHDVPRLETSGGAVEGLEHVHDSPGRVEFQLEGARARPTAAVRRSLERSGRL